jgi:hypothetical protein
MEVGGGVESDATVGVNLLPESFGRGEAGPFTAISLRPAQDTVSSLRGSRAPPELREVQVYSEPVRHWLQDLKSRFQATVGVRRCLPGRAWPPCVEMLLNVKVAPDEVAPLKGFLRSQPAAERVHMSQVVAQMILVSLCVPVPEVCAKMNERGGFCTFSQCPLLSEESQPASPTFLIPKEALLDIEGSANPPLGRGSPRIARIGSPRLEYCLSPRQDQALRKAHDLGFFDVPRRVGLREVSASMGRSSPATMEELRRAMKKLAARHLHNADA